jgi:hypothetical protein
MGNKVKKRKKSTHKGKKKRNRRIKEEGEEEKVEKRGKKERTKLHVLKWRNIKNLKRKMKNTRRNSSVCI